MVRFRGLRAVLMLASASVGVLGCSCGPGGDTSITIVDPTNGLSLTIADDTMPGVDGLQISVTATSLGLEEGRSVNLFLDGVETANAAVASDTLAWSGVTIASGSHTLYAETAEGGIRSNEVVVNASDSCFAVSFVDPAPTGSELRLSGMDDTDGEACGMTFETSFVIATAAPDGSQAQIFVNGTPRASTTVAGGSARFDGVALDNRGSTDSNAVRVVVTDAAGLDCGADFPVSIYVLCEGPSCTISLPDSSSAFLSSFDDTSAADGFQTDFELSTDTGEQARLVIDGDETGALSATFMGMTATFGNVDLTEATHRVFGECTDGVGNTTRSGVAEWTVDITECGVGIDNPTEGQSFIDTDDINGGLMGVQIGADGTAGADCQGLRVGQCTGIDSETFGTVSTTWSTEFTLSSAAMQELCVQTRDEAGNISEARVNVRLDTDAPQLQIATPTTDTRFNQATDLSSGDAVCDQAFEVYCDVLGDMVELYRVDTATLLASAPCMADMSVPSPYSGRAMFASVTLPNQEDGTSYTVEARATAGRLVGTSAPISLFSDCNAPELLVFRPMCGATLNPTTQDEDLSAPGFQYRTSVSNTDPSADVTLTIRPVGGGGATFMDTDTSVAASVNFMASYGSGGMLEIEATATDSAGNVGTSPSCVVTVENTPNVTITNPTMDAILGTADDCGAGSGMQIQIDATTDAPPGSAVSVEASTGTIRRTTTGTVGAGGVIDICADSPEGRLTVTVTVTDTRGSGAATVNVNVDTMPPRTPIMPVTTSVVDRRGGVVRFTWTAVGEGSPPVALTTYELRCASTAILTEADWTAATVFPVTTTPGSPGTVETEDISGFRPGEDLNCALRGGDIAGALTPIGDNATVTITFMQHTIELSSANGLGDEIRAVGDVNGDMVPDVLTGGEGGTAYLWFGSRTGFSAQPDVTFSSSAAGFGDQVEGIGDINADGRMDIAIAAPNAATFAGRVFVYFGRSSATPWPSTCDADLPSCVPDLTLDAETGIHLMGFSMSSADFDGDGVNDLVIGSPGSNGADGQAHVLLGGAGLTSGSTFEMRRGALTAPNGFVIAPPAGSTFFGNSVAGLGGSVDADARHDVFIGAPGFSSGDPATLLLARGQAFAGSGLTVVPVTSVETIDTAARGRFAVVAAAGDVNGDGRLDVQAYSNTSAGAGAVLVYFGTSTGFDATTVVRYRNDVPSGAAGDAFGSDLAIGRHAELGTLGLIDVDTLGDVFAGSIEVGDVTDGAARLFYGDATPVDQATSDGTPELFGMDGARRVGFVGDVDGDGFNDMAVGEPAANGGQGRLIIVY